VTELQTNRYDQLLRRVGDLKGPGSKVNDVLQELFPTIDVENVPGELLLLMGTRIGWAATSKSPTAGKKAGIQLFNPAGSGHLITISTSIISQNQNANVTWGLVIVALATNTGIPRLRDTRPGTNARGVSQLRTSADAVSLSAGVMRLGSNQPIRIEDVNSVTVLAPGSGLSVIGETDVVLTVTFFYRERIAEPSELNL